MSSKPQTLICTHIKVEGVRCGSPALRGEVFCYFHQRLIRGVTTPEKSRVHPIAFLEDEKSIQAALMEIINALIRNTIDFPRAQLILRALDIAVRNSPRVNFGISKHEMVREVPEFRPAPVPSRVPSPAFSQAAALARLPRPGRRRIKALPYEILFPSDPKPPVPAGISDGYRQSNIEDKQSKSEA